MNRVKLVAVLMVAGLLAGCGAFKRWGNADEYQQATSSHRGLLIPRGLDHSKIDDYYPIPQAEGGAVGAAVTPPALNHAK